MATRTPALEDCIAALRRQYGRPPPPAVTDPFEMALWENVAYLVPDERRAVVYGILHDKVGVTPEALLDVPAPALAKLIADGGMHPARRAEKLQSAAEIALDIGVDALRQAVRADPAAARRLLKRFPGFGDPGAEKVLLFNRNLHGLAPDSNVLRVLLRLGHGTDEGAYAKTYRSVTMAVEPQLRDDPKWLIAAHQLLRTHGKELCKNTRPRCEACPLTASCAWWAENVAR